MTHREKIKNLMQMGVELTADEIAGALDLPVTSVRPRVCDLYKDHLIERTSTIRKNRRGNPMTVWTRV